MKLISIFIILFIIVRIDLYAQGVEGTDLPYKISDTKLPSLRSRIDTNFQKRLVEKLNKNKLWRKLILEKKMCIGVIDLRNPQNIKYHRQPEN